MSNSPRLTSLRRKAASQTTFEEMAPATVPIRPVRTLADLLVELDAWTELPVKTRRVLKANVRTAGLAALTAKARMDGRKIHLDRDDVLLASAPADPAWLNKHLYAYPAAVVDVGKSCLEQSISGLRRIMRRVDLIEPDDRSSPGAGGRWHELLTELEAHVLCRGALSRFSRWCHSQGIEPEHVSRQTLELYETYIQTRTIDSEIPRLIRTIAKAWQKAAKILQGWPQKPLIAPPRRETYTLPFTAFPASLQQDVAAFAERLEGGGDRGPFSTSGLRRPLRSSSVETRLYNLRQAASALVLLGQDPEIITCLASLVGEANFEAILRFYWQRAVDAHGKQTGRSPSDLGVTSQTGGIASALMIVARYHCKLDSEVIARLRNMARDVTPSCQSQLSQKNKDRLRQFDDPVIRAKLLHLPERLMRQAEGPGVRPCEAARLARVAAALEILLHIPLRNSNLAGLRLGVHLQYGSAKRERITHLVLLPHETKNSYNGEWAVSPELSAFLHRYIRAFRPFLAMAGGDYLFPAGFGKDGSLSPGAMSQNIDRIVADEVGAVVNPHLFRCLCARFVLEHSPQAMEDVRLLIGDKSLQVVMAHYAAVEPSHACRRNDEMLRRMRRESVQLVGLPAKPARGASR